MSNSQNGDLLVSQDLKNSASNSYYFGSQHSGEIVEVELNFSSTNNETQEKEVNSITIKVEIDENGSVNLSKSELEEYVTTLNGGFNGSSLESFQIYSGESSVETLLTTPEVLLEDSFENIRGSRGKGIYEGEVEGDNGTIWNSNHGIEAQNGIISQSSNGSTHVELDAKENTTMTTTVTLTDSDSYVVSFDVNPRNGGSRKNYKDSSDMEISFGDSVVAIDSDTDGNLSFDGANDNVSITTQIQDNGWTTVTVTYDNVDAQSVDLSLSGTGESNDIGMLVDNIKVVDAGVPIPATELPIVEDTPTEETTNEEITQETPTEETPVESETNETPNSEMEQGRDSDNFIETVTYDNDENCEIDNGREVDLYLATDEADLIDGDADEDGSSNDKILFRDSDEGVTVNLETNENHNGDAEGDEYVNFEGVTGSLHDDDITGDTGANTLQGGEGDDVVNGGAGSDWIVETTDNGSDTIDGGDGEHDTVAYYSNNDVIANLETGENNQGDTLINVENLSGQFGNDTLTGDAKDNVLRGNEGEDTLVGGAGDDIIAGGADNDTIDGGADEDKIILKGYPDDYEFTQNDDGSVTVTDLRVGEANLDGTDTITNVEKVEFQYKDDSCVNHFDIATIEEAINGEVESNLGEITYSTDGFANFDNAVGFYKPNEDGSPELGKLLVDDQHTLEDGDHLAFVTPNDYSFFIIADGADQISKDSEITFDNSGDTPILLVDGVAVDVPVYFSNPDLNPGGRDHFQLELDGNGGTTIKIEDLDLGDADFDDVVMHTDFEMTDFGYDPINTIGGTDNNDWMNSTVENDEIDGGDGIDTVAYARGSDIDANLETGIVSGDGNDTLSNIENIATGNGDDTIVGSSQANRITTNGGDDTIDGGDGNDIINAGAGNDTIDGGADIDKLILKGEASNFEFVLNENGSVSVTDLSDGSVDTLTSIENVEFRYTDVDGKNHFDTESMASALINHAPEGESYEYINDGIVGSTVVEDNEPDNSDNSNSGEDTYGSDDSYGDDDTYGDDTYGDDTYGDDTYGSDEEAITNNDEFSATEDGAEFRDSEDESGDGFGAMGNVLSNDTGSNLAVTQITYGDSVVDIPTDGSTVAINSQYGTLSIDNSGAFTFVTDESNESVDALNVGDSVVDGFTYTVNGDVTAELNIKIDGSDDAPVINSMEANNQAIHTITNVMDADGDGMADYISAEEFLDGNGAQGIQFNEDNGSVTINMGNENSSMAVDYHGGNAGFKNVLGFYEKDADGNITDVKVLYSDNGNDDNQGGNSDKFLGEDSINLGTLNDLNGEVGFFIIPNGNNGDIKEAIENGYEVSIDADNQVVFTNPDDSNDTVSSSKAYYTDNDMSTDGRDHAIVTLNPDGGLTIGMEDLPSSSTDQDYDDVVFSIKPCETLGSGDTILNNVDISDVDSANLESAILTLTNMSLGDTLSADGLPDGITATISDGVIELSGSASIADYTTALESLTFQSDSNDRGVREFELEVFDGEKHSNVMSVNVDIGGCEINTYTQPKPEPVSEDGNVITCEDTTYTFTLDNFDSNANEVTIESLPTDGKIYLGDEEITSNTTVSANDINTGMLTFVADENESGRDEYNLDSVGDQQNDYAEFTFRIDDYSSTSTMSIDVTPIADNANLTISGSTIVSDEVTSIDSANVTDTSNGYSVSAFKADGSEAEISAIIGTKHDGFGVQSSKSSGANAGAATEINYQQGVGSEYVKVEFDNDVSTTNVSFAWKHSYGNVGGHQGETAVVEFYKDGELIDSMEHNGGTDKVDGPFIFETSTGEAFDEMRFSSLSLGDDYLINDVSYELASTTSSEELSIDAGNSISLDISSSLIDTDGSESIVNLFVNDLVEGMSLTDGTNTFTATADDNSVDVLSWNLDSLELNTNNRMVGGDYDLNIVATTQESLADNVDANGENCPLTKDTEVAFKVVVADVEFVPQVILEESFENLRTKNGWNVENGEDGIVVGDHDVEWDTNGIGVEVQRGIVSDSSDGHSHVELDAHGKTSNVNMTTDVELSDVLNYTMSFDIKPRPGKNDSSDMEISLDGRVIAIDTDKDGEFTINSDAPNTDVTTQLLANGWTKVTVEYSGLDTDSAELVINGTGAEDTLGMLLDNIRLVESNNQEVVIDTTPTSIDQAETLECVEGTTNVTFVVDVSSSMSNSDLDLTENAIKSLISQYDNAGDVNVNIIQTWGNAKHGAELNMGLIQESGNENISVNLITDASGTDFDQGLKATVDSYSATGDNDVVYFFADGNTYDDGSKTFESDFDEYLPTWENFVQANNIEVHTIGVNKSGGLDDLEAIGKVSNTPIDTLYVDDIKDLSDVVDGLADTLTVRVDGTLSDNIDFDGNGELNSDADFSAKGSIVSITVDGVVHEVTDGNLANLQTAEGGKLTFDFASGDYTYTINPKDSVDGIIAEKFAVVAQDSDGDTTTFNMNINGESCKIEEVVAPSIDDDTSLEFRNVEYHSDTEDNDYVETELTTGAGNDTIIVEDDVGGVNDASNGGSRTINTGAGDDTVTVGDDVQNGATINTGAGNDSVSVNGTMEVSSSINTGEGDDTINIERVQEDVTIDSGAGNDSVTLTDVSSGFDTGSVNLGDGADTLTIHDSLSGTDAIFNGGNGIDNLVLTNVSQDDWNDGINEQFTNFENVTFSDGNTISLVEPEIEVLPPENEDNLLVSENFENGAEGWSNNDTTQSDGNATNFLGRFGGTDGNEGVSKTYDFGIENAGKSVTIEFDMYEIDSWDDENFNVFVNAEEVASDTLSHFGRTWSKVATDEQDGGTELDAVGSAGKSHLDHDEAHHYTLEAKVDENGELQLGFGSTLNQSLGDESFGIDNIEIKSGDDWNEVVEDTTASITVDTTLVEVESNTNSEENPLANFNFNGYTEQNIGDMVQNQNINLSNGKDHLIIKDTAGGTNIKSGNGNDVVEIQGDIRGNTSYDGGNGSDTLVLGKSEDSYTINNMTNNNGLIACQVIDNTTGQTLTVNNIETLEFGGLVETAVINNVLEVTGTTADVEAGQIVNIKVSDSDGNSLTSESTVEADGSYSVNVNVDALIEGDLITDVDVSDIAGNVAIDSDTTEVLPPEDDNSNNQDHGNNGFGNGDQDAPGNSEDNNNAENAQEDDDNGFDFDNVGDDTPTDDDNEDDENYDDLLSDDDKLFEGEEEPEEGEETQENGGNEDNGSANEPACGVELPDMVEDEIPVVDII